MARSDFHLIVLHVQYQKTISEAADFDGGIGSFIHKIQVLFINKVRTRLVMNLNILV